MTCDEARERMVFHVDGEDDEVGRHADGCGQCGSLRDAVRAERRLLHRALKSPLRPRVAPRSAWPAIAAAAAVLFAIGLIALWKREQPAPVESAKRLTPPPVVTPPVEPAPAPVARPPEEPPKPVQPVLPPIEPVQPQKPVEPDPPKPESPIEPPKVPVKPPVTEPAPVAEVALALQKGSAKNVKWEGRRIFKSGESIVAKTSMRIDWSGADVYLQEGSSLTVTGKTAFTLEAGDVLVESAGVALTIRAGDVAFANTGTRFLVEFDGKTATATVFEGRVTCGDREVLAGERLRAGKVEPAKDAYPAWIARAMARRLPVTAFDFKSKDKRWFGAQKGGALHGLDKEGLCYTGVESEGPLLALPARGEFWVTATAGATDPITLRVRVLKPESTAYDYIVEKPVVGKPVALRVPLEKFRSQGGKALVAGDKAHILYVFTKGASLTIDDLAIVELRE